MCPRFKTIKPDVIFHLSLPHRLLQLPGYPFEVIVVGLSFLCNFTLCFLYYRIKIHNLFQVNVKSTIKKYFVYIVFLTVFQQISTL